MGLLDCHDPQTALDTLSAAIDVEPTALEAALSAFDGSAHSSEDDPQWVMPREVLASLGVDMGSVQLAGAHYFHGTRGIYPDNFRRQGILALAEMLEQIWSMLYELAGCSATEWAEFRESVEDGPGDDHDRWLYRLKVGNSLHHGPHGVLVRNVLLDPAREGWHDYLACPEIVQDIARCYGGDLEARFRAASVPCIVRIRRSEINSQRAIAAACWYLYGEGTTHVTMDGFINEGSSVPASDVLDVEVIPDR